MAVGYIDFSLQISSHYNNVRPHTAVGGIPPRQFLIRPNSLLKTQVINGGLQSRIAKNLA